MSEWLTPGGPVRETLAVIVVGALFVVAIWRTRG